MKAKHVLAVAAVCAASVFTVSSCSKEEGIAPTAEVEVSPAVLTKIQALGFSTQDVKKDEDGYLVEGDIVLTDEDLAATPDHHDHQLLRVGDEEQYQTKRLVKIPGTSRTISVRVADNLPAVYKTAVDVAIARYNLQNLRIRFTRVAQGGEIVLTKAPAGAKYLAQAGTPTIAGNPYKKIKVNSGLIGEANPTTYIASIFAHELGHCIGFRHTDYMNRVFSCGVQTGPANEGAGVSGAIQIPGTPAGPDPNSWMLACIGPGVDRPFNANDITALNFLY
jgi:hypothetical protein